MSEDLPLGYFVSDEKLLEYGRKITQGHPISDDDAISFAMLTSRFYTMLEPTTQMLNGHLVPISAPIKHIHSCRSQVGVLANGGLR